MTERLTEEQTLAAEEDMFEKAKKEQDKRHQDAAELTGSDKDVEYAEPMQVDGVASATSLTRELEEGFLIRDQSRETTINLTLEDAREYLVTPSAAGKVPTDKDLIRFLKLCQAREANPWTGDIYLIGYDNYKNSQYESTTWQDIPAYQLYVKRAENHPEYDGMESGVIVWDRKEEKKIEIEGDVFYKGEPDENGQTRYALIGGWARIHRKDKAKPEYATALLSAYKKTKPVYENGKKTSKRQASGYWATDEAWMITKCARSKAFKSAFPNECGDSPTEEEIGLHRNAAEAEVPQDRVRIGQDQQTSAADEL